MVLRENGQKSRIDSSKKKKEANGKLFQWLSLIVIVIIDNEVRYTCSSTMLVALNVDEVSGKSILLRIIRGTTVWWWESKALKMFPCLYLIFLTFRKFPSETNQRLEHG